MAQRNRRLGVLASGSGTILQALLDAGLPIAVVIVDRPCGALERAESARASRPSWSSARRSAPTSTASPTRTQVVDVAAERTRSTWSRWPGSARSSTSRSTTRIPNAVVNTHPALLPAFKGWHAVDDALAAGVKVTGCTVHLATLEVDDGPILAQEAVPVLADDTVETLHERIKEVERRLYPEVLRVAPRRHGERRMSAAARAALGLRQDGPRRVRARRCTSSGSSSCRRAAPPRRSRTPACRSHRRRRHRVARDARPPGGDAAPEGPRRDPRRPRQGVAPRRPRDARHRRRSTSSSRTSTRSSSDPSIETIDIGGPAMTARRGEEPRVGRDRHEPRSVRRACSRSCASDGAVSPTRPGARSRSRRSRTPPRTTPRSCEWLQGDDAAAAAPRARRSNAPTRSCATARTRTSRRRATGCAARRAGGTACTQHSGLALSYLNYYDTDAAWRLVHDLGDEPGRRDHQAREPVRRRGRRRPRDRVPARARVRRAVRVRRDRRAEPAGRRRDGRADGRGSAGRRRDRARLRAGHGRRADREAQEHAPARRSGAGAGGARPAPDLRRVPRADAAPLRGDARRLARRHQGSADRRAVGATPSSRGASAGT